MNITSSDASTGRAKIHSVVAPNGRVFAAADSYSECLDMATEASLKWGALFTVKLTTELGVTFPRERTKVMRLAKEWFEAHQNYPGSAVEKRAKFNFEVAQRNLTRLVKAHEELRGSDLELRCAVRP